MLLSLLGICTLVAHAAANTSNPTVTVMHTATTVIVKVVASTITVTADAAPTPSIEDNNSPQIYFFPPGALPPDLQLPSNTTAKADYPYEAMADDPDFQNATAPMDATKPLAGPLVMAYYPDWIADSFPPEHIDFSRVDWVDFAFAVPQADFTLSWDSSPTAPALLDRLVKAAHAKGKHVKLSVGGWTGSKHFSSAVANAQNRQTFVSNLAALYLQHDLDGIDVDWEYPGQQGAGGNVVSGADSANFLAFLKLLRAKLPATARLSAAAQTIPFADANGNAMHDVSAFAAVLDWVVMMNYDVWGASATPGPNAPLSDACHNSTQPEASADAAIRQWTAAGFPANKLVLGLPTYGYVSQSTASHLRQRDGSSYAPLFFPSEGAVMSPPPAPSSSSPGVPDPSSGTSSLPLGSASSSEPASSPSSSWVPPSSTSWASSSASPAPSDGVPFPGGNSTLPQDPAKPSAVTLKPDDGGQIQFRDLIAQGALCATTTNSNYIGCGGFERHWDACSGTPWLASAHAGQIVTYDDAESLRHKAELVRARGVLGTNVWDVHGDTDRWELIDAVRLGLGL